MITNTLPDNFILAVDSYKIGHWKHLPHDVTKTHSNIVARKQFCDEYGTNIKNVVVMGTQIVAYILKHTKITNSMIDEAEKEITEQGYDFPREEWEAIRDLGYIPLILRAVPEGSVIPTGLPIMTIENTDERFPWLPSYVETWAQDIVWTMTTIASKIRYVRKHIDDFCDITDTPLEHAEYMVHNFGDRGAGGRDRAVMAGIAHALFFSGSDCLEANRFIKEIYDTTYPVLSSIDANEHSVVCANSDCSNKDDKEAFEMTLLALERAVRRAKRGVGIPVISALIDTFDDERYIKEFVIPNFDRITEIGGKYVCRPDSGSAILKPIEVVKWLVEGLNKHCSLSKNGFIKLPENLAVIQGDGLKLNYFSEIIELAYRENLAASNFVFGFGGGMTNGVQRDDFSFSMKATSVYSKKDKEWRDTQKAPKTDWSKKSLSGRVTTVFIENSYKLGNIGDINDAMVAVYEDGKLNKTNFQTVRERARFYEDFK